MTKIYLACPYSSPDMLTRVDRVRTATRIAAFLMTKGYVVFSPITHGHSVAEFLPAEQAHDHEFWMQQCLPMLDTCDMLVIVEMPGWLESRGLAEERARAEALNLPELFWRIPYKLHPKWTDDIDPDQFDLFTDNLLD